ncbi:MAG TPA: potassium transporter Kup [Longimicrobiaceae bacterium]|nr:potassium transporter Kup [Longimicrobiaceae bacterium]
MGVVYGDIGTSVLYALRECFYGAHAIPATAANIMGVVSLIFWALIIVISIKYLVFVMRADNRGEGGIVALTALVTPLNKRAKGSRLVLIMMGLFGAALLYGDGMITPAITVLSAVEGLEVATTFFTPYILPITVVILIALFAVQSRGTAGIGKVFGPITLLWMATLAVLGITQIVQEPSILWAVNPIHGVEFFVRNGWRGFLILGAVFLVVTGGETLYADMGHFGKRAIRVTWFSVVLPSLLLNYFGQGALLLGDPSLINNPFFHLAPEWALYPLVVLATVAGIIASQAVISGAFSLTRQAVQLGYLPRLEIQHTSESTIGQIYIPAVNWVLMAACIGLVIGFQSSTNLAAAYGVAVTTDMVFTTILFAVVARGKWGWSLIGVGALAAGFLVVDLAFWGATMVKIFDGGWFPLVIAALVFTLMTTWKRGRAILGQRLREGRLPFEMFTDSLDSSPPTRVPGTGVFMYGNPEGTPPALLHNLKHNKVLHERVVLLAVTTEDYPYVSDDERVEVEPLGKEIYRITAHFGFAEDPDVPKVLAMCEQHGLHFKMMETTFFLGRETLIASKKYKGMAIWREKLFGFMARNAQRATEYFRIPPNRVVELGAQVEL